MAEYVIQEVTHAGSTTMVVAGVGVNLVLDSGNPMYDKIRQAAVDGAEPAVLNDLLHGAARKVAAKMSAAGSRVTLTDDGRVLFDGQPLDNRLSRAIRSRFDDGDSSWMALARFLERLAVNPSKLARMHLFSWLDDRDLTLCADGCFIAYKGVSNDGTSIHAGPGMVDGTPMVGHLPNQPGSILEIDRGVVDPDRDQGCSVGLHVGTYEYANGFGSRLLTVKVDPADVVSVPRDCDFQKMRVCRYEVIALGAPRLGETQWDDDPDDDGSDRCDECGYPSATCSCVLCQRCGDPTSDPDNDGFCPFCREAFVGLL